VQGEGFLLVFYVVRGGKRQRLDGVRITQIVRELFFRIVGYYPFRQNHIVRRSRLNALTALRRPDCLTMGRKCVFI